MPFFLPIRSRFWLHIGKESFWHEGATCFWAAVRPFSCIALEVVFAILGFFQPLFKVLAILFRYLNMC